MDLTQIREFGNIEFLAKQLVEGFITGLHKSPFHGFSVEFAEHRLYNTGESTRHIDWKAFGKTDRLYTKRYEEETNLRCQILLDVSASMYYPAQNKGKITFGITAAACLANLLQRQKDAISLCTFADTIQVHTPTKSTPTHVHKLFLLLQNLLAQEKPAGKSAVADVIHQVADKINKRSLVVILSDMFENTTQADQLFSALQHLKHNQHEVLLFHVLDKQTEADFDFEDRPYEFIDVESGERVKVQASQIKEHYRQHAQEFNRQLKLKSGQYKIDFVEADIRQGFHQILYAYLIKRSKMK